MANSHVLITRKRLLVLLIILVAFIILLMVRVGYWSLWEGNWLKAQAETQWVKETEVSAKRGAIVDRNQQVLAQSAAADTVVLLPETIAKAGNADAVADNLSQILGMDRQSVYDKATNTDKKEIWLKRQITTEQSDAIQALGLKGVSFRDDVKRFYPNKDFAAQVIGYTTLDGVGQTGIESRYNTILAGRAGRQVAETAKDGSGVPNGQEMIIQPQDGKNVVLTIDEITQSFLESACKELYSAQSPDSVQGLVIDVTNGEILAMANVPEFDLNSPPRDDSATLASLSANNVTASAYEPGSIFELFTAAAAIDSGTAAGEYQCSGTYQTGEEIASCGAAHGSQSIASALLNHCGSAASGEAQTLGKDPFYSYLKAFGFGEKTGIDFSTDTTGEVVEKRYAREEDIERMGTGTGLKTSQMQLASAVGAIVNGGKMYTPKMVLGLSDADGNMVETYDSQEKGSPVSVNTANQLKSVMETMANSEKGIQVSGYSIGALCGSAQQYQNGEVVSGKSVSTYFAYGPASNPKYLVMITAAGVPTTGNEDVVCAPYVQKALLGALKNGNIMPDETTQSQSMKTVPNVVGMELQAARDTLSEAGFQTVYDGSGIVEKQTPGADTEAYGGSSVALSMENKTTVAASDSKVTIPDFTGMSVQDARNKALSEGLVFVARGSGVAQSQSPAPGIQVEKGSSITIDFKLQIAS